MCSSDLGAYSLTQQAIQLGLLPRMEIRFTSEQHAGQTYVPQVNWMLLAGVIVLVLAFKSSSALATAYGIAVTGTMVVTVLLATIVAIHVWRWPVWKTAVVFGPFFVIDTIFLGANALKIAHGGWLPLLVGGGLLSIMLIWRRGSRVLAAKTKREDLSVTENLPSLIKKVDKVPGTAVYLTAHPEAVPSALMHKIGRAHV